MITNLLLNKLIFYFTKICLQHSIMIINQNGHFYNKLIILYFFWFLSPLSYLYLFYDKFFEKNYYLNNKK
jgi:hypothetical protein